EFVLDIDQILAWSQRENENERFAWWVSPATLVFQEISDLKLQVDNKIRVSDPPAISELTREILEATETGIRNQVWNWSITLHWGGLITFQAPGYTQYTRNKPVLLKSQKLTMAQRGGVSFQRQTYDNNTNK